MKYWKARQLSSKKFKRKTGISPRTYGIMVRLVKDKQAEKKKPGRPHELRIEEQVLITFGLTSNLIAGVYNYELAL